VRQAAAPPRALKYHTSSQASTTGGGKSFQEEGAKLAYESHANCARLRFSNGIVLRAPNKELACYQYHQCKYSNPHLHLKQLVNCFFF
jgi:hypothetical protein